MSNLDQLDKAEMCNITSVFYNSKNKLMHKLTIYPIGNADCIQIQLQNEKRALFDYADMHDPEDKQDRRCDLGKEIRESLEEDDHDSFSIVAFTHLDEDHTKRASEFFEFEYAKSLQGDGRIKIDTLWVPAAAITEENLDKEDAKRIQKEARYRFKNGKGIRVFSRPKRLEEWCRKNNVNFEERKHLITDAGNLAPEFTLEEDGVEFFVHSPFAKRLNENEVEDRNQDAIVMQATFEVDGVKTRAHFMGDATYDVLQDIVAITESRKRTERLEWDVCKLPHHCSYLSLSEEKGDDKTSPELEIKRLYEDYSQAGAIIISTSKPIPKKGSDEDSDKQPPHRQAANYYKDDAVKKRKGEFHVTMEHPTESAPKPIIIQIDGSKATVLKRAASIGAAAIGTSAPRAGSGW